MPSASYTNADINNAVSQMSLSELSKLDYMMRTIKGLGTLRPATLLSDIADLVEKSPSFKKMLVDVLLKCNRLPVPPNPAFTPTVQPSDPSEPANLDKVAGSPNNVVDDPTEPETKKLKVEHMPTQNAFADDGWTMQVIPEKRIYDNSNETNRDIRALVKVCPPADPGTGQPSSKLLTLVLDNSGSMMGKRVEQLRTALERLAVESERRRLNPDPLCHIFIQLCCFGDDVENLLREKDQSATVQMGTPECAAALRSAGDYLEGQSGQTHLSGGLEWAVKAGCAALERSRFDTWHVLAMSDGRANLGLVTADKFELMVRDKMLRKGVDHVHMLGLTASMGDDLLKAITGAGNGIASFSPEAEYLVEGLHCITSKVFESPAPLTVNNQHGGMLTAKNNSLVVSFLPPRGVGEGSELVFSVNASRGRLLEPLKGHFKVKICAPGTEPADQTPQEFKDALDALDAKRELQEELEAKRSTFGRDVGAAARCARKVLDSFVARGFSEAATARIRNEVDVMADSADDPHYRSLAANSERGVDMFIASAASQGAY